MASEPPLKDFLGLVGVSVGPYVVREISSLGGVALVYRGEHETLHNAVAVKVLTPEVATEEVRGTLEELFLREAQILSQLRSEHILRAHDHGRVACPADGRERPYMVIDWLEGHTLSDELDVRRREQRPYGLAEAVELLEPVALALDAAHAAGIIHRDVNPRNIFLEKVGSGQPPHAKLIDFGFAKDVAQTRALQLQRVHGTLLARSPDYAAPEHYDREKYGELSENTDLYTFALCFVNMLTLESPLRGATNEALALATSNVADRPTPNRRGARVPQAVERLFAEALAVDQFERPGSVLAWFRQLEEAVKRPSLEPAASTKPQRRRGISGVLIFLIALIVLAAAAGAAFLLLRPLECPPGFADCNAKRGDGCEVELATSNAHCGGCNHACSSPQGEAICKNGTCRIERCYDERSKDCNGSALDGCEVDTASDARNCGGCGVQCGNPGTSKVACRSGRCELTCREHLGDCDRNPENGCEVRLASDKDNCGRCGFGCRETRCERGFCVPAKLAQLEPPFELGARSGEVTVWEEKTGRLRRISASGAERVLAPSIPRLTALAVGAGAVLFASGEPVRVFALPNEAAAGLARPIGGPLASETALVLDLEARHVTFVDRSPRGKGKPVGPTAKRSVVTLELGADAKPSINQCPDWPARFAGDGRQQFCCDEAKPLTSISCPGGKCTAHRHPIPCPAVMVLDDDRLYFARGTRLFALERASGKAVQLAKRVRAPRQLAQDATHLYWLEGDQAAAIFRLRKPEAASPANEPPDAVAAELEGAGWLAVDETSIYWTAGSPSELFALKKPL